MEWTNSAMAMLFLLVLIPLALVYIVIRKTLHLIPVTRLFIEQLKSNRFFIYVIFQVTLFVISVGLTWGILGVVVLIKGNGLLE